MSDNPYRDKLLTVGVLSGGRSKSSIVKEDSVDGVRRKHTTDERGNTTTEWNNKKDRVDVMIRPETVYMKVKAN